jgi:hypothetical protein
MQKLFNLSVMRKMLCEKIKAKRRMKRRNNNKKFFGGVGFYFLKKIIQKFPTILFRILKLKA